MKTRSLFIVNYSLFTVLCALFTACIPDNVPQSDTEVSISPDYSGITIPPNIAPLCFEISGEYDAYVTQAFSPDGFTVTVKGRDVVFPIKKWKKLLALCRGKELHIRITVKKDGHRQQFPDIVNFVAPEPIDPYLTYRLIEPLYESWGQMGIYQRNLESFDEREILHNRTIGSRCVNCHAFQNYRTEHFLFHIRGKDGKTIFVNDGKVTGVQTKPKNGYAPAVYPAWHPSLPLVAFSTNTTGQVFHSADKNLVEVIDFRSDLTLLHVKTNTLQTIAGTDDVLETFPSWSPDGRYLYYCAAKTPVARTDYDNPQRKVDVADSFDRIRYDILRKSFRPDENEFGVADTVFAASHIGKSATLPRISPDGKYLLMTVGNYGNFHIWHKESDLYLLNTETGECSPADELNSREAESFHNWSSNGRWIVFSSRRDDGAFTRPYFAYFDVEGKARKPFVLPQKNPAYHQELLKSYNIPEFTVEPIRENEIKKRLSE